MKSERGFAPTVRYAERAACETNTAITTIAAPIAAKGSCRADAQES